MPSASCDGVFSRSVSPVGVAIAACRANSRPVKALIYRLRATTRANDRTPSTGASATMAHFPPPLTGGYAGEVEHVMARH